MKFELHESAKTVINEKANELLLFLKPKKNEKVNNENSFKTDTPTRTFTKFPKEFYFDDVDSEGKTIGRYFSYQNLLIGLHTEEFIELKRLSERFLKDRLFRNSVSLEFLVEKIFDWMKEKYIGSTKSELVDYIITICEKEVKPIEIIIPIEMTTIEEPLIIGRIEIKEFKKEIFDFSYNELIKNYSDSEKQMLKDQFDNLRNEYQGGATAVFKIEAEPILAKELAFHELNKSLSLLRFYHKASIYPESICYSNPPGNSNQYQSVHFSVENSIIAKAHKGYKYQFDQWAISKNLINNFKVLGLDNLHQLLIIEKNEFQTKLLESLLIFSRCSISVNLTDKLTSIIVALETFMLRDESESIQANIADRIAYTISNNANDRIKIVSIVKKAYSLRSRFLHHGQTIEDLDLIREFMLINWSFFHFLISNIFNQAFKTMNDYFLWLDRRKYS